jgi:16S rRNA (cytosine1402-N4)-methyltransferase
VVNTYSVGELAKVISRYGEERFARPIAHAIVRRRDKGRLTSSAELAELVRDAIPAPARRTGGHPAKRTFQALRIEVNAELDVLSRALPEALGVLRVHGRLAVLSYHSLEDRMVKQAMAPLTLDTTPPGLPVPLPDAGPQLAFITRGAELPDAREITENPRAASARLRVAQRLRGAA